MEALTQQAGGGGFMCRAEMGSQSWKGRVSVSMVNMEHVDYYHNNRDDKKMKKKEKVGLKKKLKLLKGLSKDLSVFSGLDFGGVLDQDHQNNNPLIDQVRGKMITEASEMLLKQLEQLKAEEKELKRKKKEEKAKLKAMRQQMSSESSSSSSESECEKKEKRVSCITKELPVPVVVIEEGKENRVNGEETSCSSSSNGGGDVVVEVTKSTKKIEVCMGSKCKKSGSLDLMEEFQRVMGGIDDGGAVVGCKCMGKCKNAPNVRLFNSDSSSSSSPTNPLFIGVGLEDVGAIVGNFFAQDSKELGFNPAT